MDNYKMDMKAQSVKIRTVHPVGYRPGEWALVVGVCMVTPTGRKPRLCYAVRYDDGFVDYKVLEGAEIDNEIIAI